MHCMEVMPSSALTRLTSLQRLGSSNRQTETTSSIIVAPQFRLGPISGPVEDWERFLPAFIFLDAKNRYIKG